MKGYKQAKFIGGPIDGQKMIIPDYGAYYECATIEPVDGSCCKLQYERPIDVNIVTHIYYQDRKHPADDTGIFYFRYVGSRK